jgi:hypothetical protein
MSVAAIPNPKPVPKRMPPLDPNYDPADNPDPDFNPLEDPDFNPPDKDAPQRSAKRSASPDSEVSAANQLAFAATAIPDSCINLKQFMSPKEQSSCRF